MQACSAYIHTCRHHLCIKSVFLNPQESLFLIKKTTNTTTISFISYLLLSTYFVSGTFHMSSLINKMTLEVAITSFLHRKKKTRLSGGKQQLIQGHLAVWRMKTGAIACLVCLGPWVLASTLPRRRDKRTGIGDGHPAGSTEALSRTFHPENFGHRLWKGSWVLLRSPPSLASFSGLQEKLTSL